MLLVLPPTKTNLATLFLARYGRTWVVKRATLLFNLVCSNMLQTKLHDFCCPFYCSFSLVLYSFFGVPSYIFIQNYVDFGPLLLGIIIHFVQVWNWTLSTSVTGETSVTVSPECTNYIGGFRGMLPPEKKNWKLDSRKGHILHSLDRKQLIHTSILLSFQFSVSLIIIFVRCFQSHFKVKQIASYSTWSHS